MLKQLLKPQVKEKNLSLPPEFIVINVNDDCFFKCKMCFKWKPHITHTKDTKFITTSDIKNFIYDLSLIVEKPSIINFAGGEPFLRKDLLEIIKFTDKLGFYTTVATNGWLIDSEEKAKKIIDSGLKNIVFSVDGMTAKTHDYIRGIPGSFNRIKDAMQYLIKNIESQQKGFEQKEKLSIAIQTVLCELNYKEVIDMINWVEKTPYINSIHFNAVSEPNNTMHDPLWYKTKFSYLWPKNIKKICLVIDEIYKKKREGSKVAEPLAQIEGYKRYFINPEKFLKKSKCHFEKALSLTPVGAMYMCNHYINIGNIKETRLSDAWKGYNANKVRQYILNCQENCHELVNCYHED